MSRNPQPQQPKTGQRQQRCMQFPEYSLLPTHPRMNRVVNKDQAACCSDQSNNLNQVYPLIQTPVENPDVFEGVDLQNREGGQEDDIQPADDPDSYSEQAVWAAQLQPVSVMPPDQSPNGPEHQGKEHDQQ